MRALAVAVALVALVGCARATPRPHDAIKFAHGPHLLSGAQCLNCHAPVRDAARADDPSFAGALPSEQLCKSCHTRPRERACQFCHEHPEIASTYTASERHIVFDHARHVGTRIPAGGCVRCHAARGGDESVAAFEPAIPPMEACTASCHAPDMRALECSRCHTDLHSVDRDRLRLVRHPPGFLREHGARARTSDNLCGQCHEPTFCSDCHRASPSLPLELLRSMNVTREFVHAGDFRARHPSEARLEQATCLRCHGVSFCDDCHRETGIGGSVANGSPHPPGWLDPLSSQGHPRAARRDILTCAGCHESDAEQRCVPCHRVGGIAGNPHPPGFGSGMDRMQVGVCRVCHAEGP